MVARAEGIGVGWVTIFNDADRRAIFDLPEHVVPAAYLCLCRVAELYSEPELQARSRHQRIDIKDLIFADRWGRRR